ncbi:hypothetical protein GCM10019059_09850 [Camelimonas fluminis]|nr:hypothetical protein GCM10019059_09850 [Camelimonas fluminis]
MGRIFRLHRRRLLPGGLRLGDALAASRGAEQVAKTVILPDNAGQFGKAGVFRRPTNARRLASAGDACFKRIKIERNAGGGSVSHRRVPFPFVSWQPGNAHSDRRERSA